MDRTLRSAELLARGIARRSFGAFVTILALVAVSPAQDLPEYRVGRTRDTITVDGRLTEFSWQAAPRTRPFIDIRGKDNTLRTEAAILWDDRNIYFAFTCVDPEPWSTMLDRDAFLWEQEVVEVFLDPDGDGLNYPEIEVSPHNVVVDLLIPAPRKIPPEEAAKWDVEGMRTAVAKYGPGWTVEISMPWTSLKEGGIQGPPRLGDRWRVGLYRIERSGGTARWRKSQASGQPVPGEDQFQAWSPTENSFHEPDRFGIVEFVLEP